MEKYGASERPRHNLGQIVISIPYPKAPVIIEITARDKADMQFHLLLKQEIDPASIFIDRGKLKENRITKIQYNGDSSGKVDLVFLAEGYTADEQEKFVADAKRFTEALFKTPPYDTRREDFNVWAVDAVSEESGTDVSGKGIFKNTALNSGYYTFGVDRYLTTPDMKSIRDAVWNVPCDAIFLLIKHRYVRRWRHVQLLCLRDSRQPTDTCRLYT